MRSVIKTRTPVKIAKVSLEETYKFNWISKIYSFLKLLLLLWFNLIFV